MTGIVHIYKNWKDLKLTSLVRVVDLHVKAGNFSEMNTA